MTWNAGETETEMACMLAIVDAWPVNSLLIYRMKEGMLGEARNDAGLGTFSIGGHVIPFS